MSDRVVWESHKLLVSWDFQAQQPLELIEDSAKKQNTPSEENGLTGLSWQERNLNTNNQALEQCSTEEHLWTQHMEPWSG